MGTSRRGRDGHRAGAAAIGAAVLVLAACSSAKPVHIPERMPVPSEDVEIMSSRFRPASAPIEPEVVLEIVPDPEEVPAVAELPPLPDCLPAGSGATIALEAEALRACWNRSGNFPAPPDACLWIGKDGSVRTDAAPAPSAPAYPRTTTSSDGKTAQVCLAADRCTTLTPELGAGQRVEQAELDDDHERVALLLTDPDTGDGTVEIYSAHDGRLLARGVRSSRHRGARHAIDFIGAAVLWIHDPNDSEFAIGELWKTKRTKLKLRKKLRGHLGQWGSIGNGRFVFSDDGIGAQVWDVRQARRVAKVEIDGLLDREQRAAWMASGDASLLATTEGAFALMAVTRGTVRVAFVDATVHRPKPLLVSAPLCD